MKYEYTHQFKTNQIQEGNMGHIKNQFKAQRFPFILLYLQGIIFLIIIAIIIITIPIIIIWETFNSLLLMSCDKKVNDTLPTVNWTESQWTREWNFT